MKNPMVGLMAVCIIFLFAFVGRHLVTTNQNNREPEETIDSGYRDIAICKSNIIEVKLRDSLVLCDVENELINESCIPLINFEKASPKVETEDNYSSKEALLSCRYKIFSCDIR